MAMSNPYFNDKKKLADAIALARSFSKTKATRTSRDTEHHAHSRVRGAPLRGSVQPQLIHSIVRPDCFSETGYRQSQQQCSARRKNTISMAAWQAQKDVSSITGGRGLDFLNRKDVPDIAPAVQPGPVVVPESLPSPPYLVEAEPMVVNGRPAATATTSVLDEFWALMSQREKEEAQVGPLVDKLQQWNLQSPSAVAKPTAANIPAAPISHQSLIDWKKVSIKENNGATVSQTMTESKVAVVQKGQENDRISGIRSVGEDSIRNGPTFLSEDGDISNLSAKIESYAEFANHVELPRMTAHLPPTPQEEEKSRSALETIEQQKSSIQPAFSTEYNGTATVKSQKGLETSHFASNEIKHIILQPEDKPRLTPGAMEQLMKQPETPEPTKCNCTPSIKPQKGLAASRFASKETENSPFAKKFSVSLEITIHQDFCPLSEKKEPKSGRGSSAETPQQMLRAEAVPFTPQLYRQATLTHGFEGLN